jgi:UDP-2,3-diacylglucosamine pyrophosphatase LpxH
MKTLDGGNCACLIIVSDVHLLHPTDDKSKIFLEFLKTLPPCETLLLAGDIFDFIFARKSFFYEHWSEVFEALAQVKNKGIRVVFLEGNHDFGFDFNTHPKIQKCLNQSLDGFWRCTHPLLGNIQVAHGDNLICPKNYFKFRAVVKSKWFQWIAGLFPGVWLHWFFLKVASGSRAKDRYRPLPPERFSQRLQDHSQWFGFPNSGVWILGHVHLFIKCAWSGVQLFCGPSWNQAPSYLLISPSGQCERVFVKGSGVETYFPSGALGIK